MKILQGSILIDYSFECTIKALFLADRSSLEGSFSFDDTPQGWEYWYSIAYEKGEFTLEVKRYLFYLLLIHDKADQHIFVSPKAKEYIQGIFTS